MYAGLRRRRPELHESGGQEGRPKQIVNRVKPLPISRCVIGEKDTD